MTPIEYFKATYGLRDRDVLLVDYGSRVYGTHTDKSDYDYLAIIPASYKQLTGTEWYRDNINIHIFNEYDFQKQLNLHKIHTLEGYFYSEECHNKFDFSLDKSMLRHELSQKSSHSFVKAKKKITIEYDYYIGWKSLFHSLRILIFGIQIATKGKIYDFSEANHYWTEILEAQEYNWDYFKTKYQPIYNDLASQFRLVAPKDRR